MEESVCVSRDIYKKVDGAWQEGLIQILNPVHQTDCEHPHWECKVLMSWTGFRLEKSHRGADAYQALELAMRLVPTLIAATDDFHDRKIALHEGEVVLDSRTIREFFHSRIMGDV